MKFINNNEHCTCIWASLSVLSSHKILLFSMTGFIIYM